MASYNVSARPLEVEMTCKSLTGGQDKSFVLIDFPNDTDPVEIEPVMYGEPIMDINGNLIRKRRHVPVKVSIALIPGSKNEKEVSDVLYGEFINGSAYSITLTLSFKGDDIRIGNKNLEENKYIGGRFIGATMGYAVTHSGAVKTKIYHFVFKNGNHG